MYEVTCQCQITHKVRGSRVKKETVKRKKNSNKEKTNNNKIIKDNNANNKTTVK